LAVAALGFVLSATFNNALDRRMKDLPVEVRAQVDTARPRLAAGSAAIEDVRGRNAMKESFVIGFRVVARIACGLSLVSSLTVALLIGDSRRSSGKPVN
jgi:hypothetical protein